MRRHARVRGEPQVISSRSSAGASAPNCNRRFSGSSSHSTRHGWPSLGLGLGDPNPNPNPNLTLTLALTLTFGLPRVLEAVEHRRSKGRAHRLDLLLRWSG